MGAQSNAGPPRGRNVVASIGAFQAPSTGSNPVGRIRLQDSNEGALKVSRTCRFVGARFR